MLLRYPLLYAVLAAICSAEAGQSSPQPIPRWGQDTIREPGRCSLSSETCGSKGGIFGAPLPCASNEVAVSVDERGAAFETKLEVVCGSEVAASWLSTCCDERSVDKLSQSLQQAQAFIALCPACSKSFTQFYCHFTCSPNQSQFVTVSAIQGEIARQSIQILATDCRQSSGDLQDDKGPAVKSLDLHVADQFGHAFYEACKDVKFAATNGLAMEFSKLPQILTRNY